MAIGRHQPLALACSPTAHRTQGPAKAVAIGLSPTNSMRFTCQPSSGGKEGSATPSLAPNSTPKKSTQTSHSIGCNTASNPWNGRIPFIIPLWWVTHETTARLSEGLECCSLHCFGTGFSSHSLLLRLEESTSDLHKPHPMASNGD